MLYKSHYIEIYINGELLELESQNSLNLRLNNTLYNPTEIGSSQAEYSFSFDIPSTPSNDKIFDYANCLDKPSKFHQRRDAEVYADGQLIFEGTLLVNGYKNKKYQCNLVSVKVYSLEDIFGDAVLTDIPWYKEFSGVTSINSYNSGNTDVVFPLISYGVFQKTPKFSDEVANDYTPKHDLDKYNKWYMESFYPSLNMLESIKKAFEWKGYYVSGDVFSDDYLKNVYMSCNLADEQIPVYNLANKRLGEVDLTVSFSTTGTSGYNQQLNFPYYRVSNGRAGFHGANVQIVGKTYEAYNFDEVVLYDLLSSGSTTVNHPSYMYDPNEKCIVIPADGYYKIEMTVTTTLNTSTPTFTAAQHKITNDGGGDDIEFKDITGITKNLYETCPIEVQLVRNYSDNLELIKGKWNKQYVNGNPTQSTYTLNDRTYNNINEWQTCFPHEDAYQSSIPTKTEGLTLSNTPSYFGGENTGDRRTIGEGGSRTNPRTRATNRSYSSGNYGYVYANNQIMAYDPAVSEGFICGFSSIGVQNNQGVRAVIKNGYSWTKSNTTLNEDFYYEPGYLHLFRSSGDTGTIEEQSSSFNQNTYPNSPTYYMYAQPTHMAGGLSCMVWLNRNDILELFQVHRYYEQENGVAVYYGAQTTVDLKITAASPRSYNMLRSIDYGYYSESEFDKDLKLSNFLNKDVTVASHIQSIIDAFNLEMTQNGKNVWINRKKQVVNGLPAVVNLDNRTNANEAETSNIEYPSSMAIIYKTDVEEYGYWLTIPEAYRNEDDWEKYGDSGYTVIKLSDDNYNVDSAEKSLNYSYTWYDNFNWKEVDSGGTENSAQTPTLLTIPVISKYEYMAEGYSYDESMKHDGYSLSQRFWFKPEKTDTFVWTSSYPTEKVDIYVPKNIYNGLNLSYKTGEISILSNYFNLRPYLSSNYVDVEVYLTPDEYWSLKNGGNATFDTELYAVVNIEGYDATGANKTKLRLMKLS